MEFSREECWSWLPFPPPGDLPNPGMELRSPALQEEKGTTEDEMAGWHHRLDGREFA